MFTAITNRASHLPFRNSKLTYLMAPCLSGDGKTLMVVNVAPEVCGRVSTDNPRGGVRPYPSLLRGAQVSNSMESLSSLRFASQVNACEIGRPKRSVKAGDSAGEGRPPATAPGGGMARGLAAARNGAAAKRSGLASASTVSAGGRQRPSSAGSR